MQLILLSSSRQWLFTQLDHTGWKRRGVSPLNALFLLLIALNVVFLILETEPALHEAMPGFFDRAEFVLLWFFAIEYVLRVFAAGERPEYAGILGRLRYMVSPVALIDLAATAPGFFLTSGGATSALRVVRLLRVLRFARFGAFTLAAHLLRDVFYNRRHELGVSIALALLVCVASATAMYLVEGDVKPEQFGSIPRAMWWSIITMTTVGYGDAYPETPLGKFVAGIVAICGVASVAVPTGILASAFSDIVQERKRREAEAASRGPAEPPVQKAAAGG